MLKNTPTDAQFAAAIKRHEVSKAKRPEGAVILKPVKRILATSYGRFKYDAAYLGTLSRPELFAICKECEA